MRKKRCGRKDQRQEKWLRKVIAMATCEERKDRIPEIKMLRTLLMVTDDSGRERKRACRAADFLLCPEVVLPIVVRSVLEHNQEILQKVLAVLERNEYTVTKGSKKRMRTGSN